MKKGCQTWCKIIPLQQSSIGIFIQLGFGPCSLWRHFEEAQEMSRSHWNMEQIHIESDLSTFRTNCGYFPFNEIVRTAPCAKGLIIHTPLHLPCWIAATQSIDCGCERRMCTNFLWAITLNVNATEIKADTASGNLDITSVKQWQLVDLFSGGISDSLSYPITEARKNTMRGKYSIWKYRKQVKYKKMLRSESK